MFWGSGGKYLTLYVYDNNPYSFSLNDSNVYLGAFTE